MLGVPPPPPPQHSAIGNIHSDFCCYWVLLHYNMSFKTIAGGFNGAFWWYGPLSEDREFKKTNLPKLSCGYTYKDPAYAFMVLKTSSLFYISNHKRSYG